MTNDINSIQKIYDGCSEKELMKMWEDISGNNFESLNKSLIKAIGKSESEKQAHDAKMKEIQETMFSKQMWDSETASWVPFDLWGANYIVNERKEYVVIRIYRPCDVQPECGPVIKGWHSLDSSYLNEKLKESNHAVDQYNGYQSFAGHQAFYEMMKQDKNEYQIENRINESSYGNSGLAKFAY